MAYTYECVHKHNPPSAGHRHDQGSGKPTRKRCSGCGGQLRIRQGKWGVFVHSSFNGGDARYREQDAIATFDREAAAERLMRTDERYVTRFVTV